MKAGSLTLKRLDRSGSIAKPPEEKMKQEDMQQKHCIPDLSSVFKAMFDQNAKVIELAVEKAISGLTPQKEVIERILSAHEDSIKKMAALAARGEVHFIIERDNNNMIKSVVAKPISK